MRPQYPPSRLNQTCLPRLRFLFLRSNRYASADLGFFLSRCPTVPFTYPPKCRRCTRQYFGLMTTAYPALYLLLRICRILCRPSKHILPQLNYIVKDYFKIFPHTTDTGQIVQSYTLDRRTQNNTDPGAQAIQISSQTSLLTVRQHSRLCRCHPHTYFW
jgi:hypothetical protein